MITKGSDVKQKLGNPMQMRPDGNTVVGELSSLDVLWHQLSLFYDMHIYVYYIIYVPYWN